MINDHEKLVLERTLRGEWVEFARTNSDPRPVISAGFLRSLLLRLPLDVDGIKKAVGPLPNGVRIRGAKIEDNLYLSDGRRLPGLSLEDCELTGDIYLYDAEIAHFSLKRSQINGVRLKGVTIGSTLDFAGVRPPQHPPEAPAWSNAHGCRIKGGVRGDGAKLRARVIRDPTKPLFKGMEYYALRLSDSEIEGSLRLRPYRLGPSFEAHGGINISAAHIRGDIIATGARLVGVEAHALTAQASRISGVVFLDELYAEGTIWLEDAHISGKLSLSGAKLYLGRENHDNGTLNLSHAIIEGDVLMEQIERRHERQKIGFEALGRVTMGGIKIWGSLRCERAYFDNGIARESGRVNRTDPNVKALMADGAEIRGAVLIISCCAVGRVTFRGALIGGDFDAAKATFRNIDGPRDLLALDLTSAVIGRNANLEQLGCLGGMSLINSKINGDLNLKSAELIGIKTNEKLYKGALNATNVEVNGNVIFESMTALGDRSLARAMISGLLNWEQMKFPITLMDTEHSLIVPDKGEIFDQAELVLEHAKIGKELRAHDLQCGIPNLIINLSAATVHTLDDDLLIGEPDKNPKYDGWGFNGYNNRDRKIAPRLRLDGFTYERIKSIPHMNRKLVKYRRRWLNREYDFGQDRKEWDFKPQPYLHLAKVFRQQGHLAASRGIAIYEANESRPYWMKILFGKCFGYGLSYTRASLTFAIFFFLGWSMVALAYYEDVLVLTPNLVQSYDDELLFKPSSNNSTNNGFEQGMVPYILLDPVGSSIGAPKYKTDPFKYLPSPQWQCHPNEIQPWIYSLDLMLPVIPLHQADRCEVQTASSNAETFIFLSLRISHLLLWHIAFALFSVFGKVVTSLWALTFSGLIKPREE